MIRILLIAGLVYFALQQKQESTRNMILIVTGLLAVCMMSREGFTLTSASGGTGMSAWGGASPQSGNTITSTDGSTVFTFALPADGELDLDGSTPDITDKVTCTVDDGGGAAGGIASLKVNFATLPAVTIASDITTYLDCNVDAAVPPPDTPSPCPSTICPPPPPPSCPPASSTTCDGLQKFSLDLDCSVCATNTYEKQVDPTSRSGCCDPGSWLDWFTTGCSPSPS